MTTDIVPCEYGSDGNVSVEFIDTTAFIHMRCGENRLNPVFISKMNNALDEVESNANAQVLVTMGDGKFYCNGLDLDWLQRQYAVDPEKAIEFGLGAAVQLYGRILTFPMPTIAAINGHCYAGGVVFALSHDLCIMNRTRGWLCLNEVHINLRFGKFITALLKAKLPTGPTFNAAVVLGRRYTAVEAHRSAIVQQTCELPALRESAIVAARSLVAKRPYNRDHLSIMKNDMYEGVMKELASRTDIGLGSSKL